MNIMHRHNPKAPNAFTLLELLLAAAASVLIGGAIIGSMISLQKTFVATENYSKSQIAQMRLLDFVANDLRRSGSNHCGWISANTSGSLGNSYAAFGTYLTSSAAIRTGTALSITIPAFYRAQASSDTQSNPSATSWPSFDADNALSYSGTNATSTYTTIQVTYRKAYIKDPYGSQCYIRNESTLPNLNLVSLAIQNGTQGLIPGDRVIASNAEGLLLEVATSSSDPNVFQTRARFATNFNRTGLPSQPKIGVATDGVSAAETVTRRNLF